MRISATKWTTERVDGIVEGIDKTGRIPKETPFFDNDTDWRSPNIDYSYTQKEVAEMLKCQRNILYFGENYAKVMTDDGIMVVKLRDYQVRCLVQFAKYRKNIMLSSRQSGKCVNAFTEIEVDGGNRLQMWLLYYKNKNKSLLDWVEMLLYCLIDLLSDGK